MPGLTGATPAGLLGAFFEGSEEPDLTFVGRGICEETVGLLHRYVASSKSRARSMRRFCFGGRVWSERAEAAVCVFPLPRHPLGRPLPPPRAQMCFGHLWIPGNRWAYGAIQAYLDEFLRQGLDGDFAEV